VRAAVLAVQGAVRLVYAIDITIRSALARRHVHYLLTHPVAIAAVVLPPMRVIFSLRLVRSVFRRGHLGRFLLAALVLVLNGGSSCTWSSGTRPATASTPSVGRCGGR
jgi:hypothetical protein